MDALTSKLRTAEQDFANILRKKASNLHAGVDSPLARLADAERFVEEFKKLALSMASKYLAAIGSREMMTEQRLNILKMRFVLYVDHHFMIHFPKAEAIGTRSWDQAFGDEGSASKSHLSIGNLDRGGEEEYQHSLWGKLGIAWASRDPVTKENIMMLRHALSDDSP